MARTKVLIVDDSALIRQLLTEILSSDPQLEVVGTAGDPYVARDKIKKLQPDVLTLDVEMPRMDGVTFLKNLMRLRPMPVVMISSLTAQGAEVTLEALEIGAVEFVTKPTSDVSATMEDYAEDIIHKVKLAAQSRVLPYEPPPSGDATMVPKLSADAVIGRSQPKKAGGDQQIVAIGASTGGTEAIREVMMQLPADFPAVVIAQHIPEAFSGPFAARLNSHSAMRVKEAVEGEQILPGHAYVAPGSHHLLVLRRGSQYVCSLSEGPRVNRHRPSVDVLFRSVAQVVGKNAVGVLLTGMGDDGARGLKEMQEAGASTVAQDENTSVVWGMPGEAVKLGAADAIKSLRSIPAHLCSLMKR